MEQHRGLWERAAGLNDSLFVERPMPKPPAFQPRPVVVQQAVARPPAAVRQSAPATPPGRAPVQRDMQKRLPPADAGPHRGLWQRAVDISDGVLVERPIQSPAAAPVAQQSVDIAAAPVQAQGASLSPVTRAPAAVSATTAAPVVAQAVQQPVAQSQAAAPVVQRAQQQQVAAPQQQVAAPQQQVAAQAAPAPAPQQPVTNAAAQAPAAIDGGMPPSGTGTITNNQTGAVTQIGQPRGGGGGGGGGGAPEEKQSITGRMPRQGPKAPTPPQRTPVAMPVLSGGGGAFSAMVDFAGQASQAGTAIQNNRGNNRSYQNHLEAFNAEQRERIEYARQAHEAEQRDADRAQRGQESARGHDMNQKKLGMDQQRLAMDEKKVGMDRYKPVDIHTGKMDEMGNPIKQTVLLDIGKLGSDGNPIYRPISPQADSAPAAPASQSYSEGGVYRDAQGNRALWNGSSFEQIK